ncbi:MULTISPECIES: diguanylate cyclase [unclassified Uliginosibacterium]|uniref:TackOD1 domain-containing metal-binding protein n=1 Tax=unclassified Uliginosibacterium TaxID=2621521 RepID=UPI000C7CCDA4|nr:MULTISPECIES: diguanylate cyclase [unclassified Uliginosibacterium]MDO6386572.1 diguanylate cyclase [Uliginosibacterium sp. 31-12]PLK50408.1 hypothetical protein C0V76_00835 [Uliginosibacterium sp. TH139]
MQWIGLSEQPASVLVADMQRLDLAALLAEEPRAPVLLETSAWPQAAAWVRAIRAQPALSHLPLFLATRPDGAEPPGLASLLDGIALDAAGRDAQAGEIMAQAARLTHVAATPGEALAQYLACRPAQRLHPVKDWTAPAYYRYPLVETLLTEGEDPYVWLERWSRRRILDTEVVVDRLRLCDQCSSAHMNHVDVCPSCASIDITSTRLLHCFTCGHVDQQESFQRQHRLECPKCSAALRHIGVDYDRPLEQLQCRQCKNLFVDADVRSQCMACGASSSPERLPVRPIAVYRLGGAGLLLARQGNLSPVLSGLDTVNFIVPALFERLLDWQIALARRYPESHFFSVIGLRVRNLEELVSTLGRSVTATLIDGFAERLRATLRTTDLTTRGDDDHIWLLTPHTDEAGARLLVSRMRELGQASRQANAAVLALSTAVVSMPGADGLPLEANQLMGLMASRLETEIET